MRNRRGLSEMKAVGPASFVIGFILLSTVLPVSTDETADQFVITREQNVMQIAEQALRNFKNTCDLVSTCQGHKTCSKLECHPFEDKTDNLTCVDLSNTTYCSTSTSIRVNKGRAIVRVRPAVYNDYLQNDNSAGYAICAQRELDGLFREILINETNAFLSIHFGSNDGMIRIFPGREILYPQCGTYDPRRRDWYIGAMSVLIDVVVLVDMGWYMVKPTFDSWTAIQSAIAITTDLSRTIPKGQSRNQHSSRLTIIPFNESGTIFPDVSQFQYIGQPDDSINLKEDLERISPSSSVTANGPQSNFTAAFDGALRVFGPGNSSTDDGALKVFGSGNSSTDALQVVIFLTDLDYLQTESSSPTIQENATVFELWQQRQPGARLFIYDFGNSDSQEKWPALACQVEGYYERLDNSAVARDPLSSIKAYFNFLAHSRLIANNNTAIPFWLPTYVDASGLGNLFAVSYPVILYADGSGGGFEQLIGVAGTVVKYFGSDPLSGSSDSLPTQVNNLLQTNKTLETAISTYPAGAPIPCEAANGSGIPSCKPPSNYQPICPAKLASSETLKNLLCGCENSQNSKKSAVLVILVCAIGGSAGLLLFISAIVYCFARRPWAGTQRRRASVETPCLNEYSYEELKQGTEEFAGANIIGRGKFGVVFRAVLRNVRVAVKRLNDPVDSSDDFHAEMKTLGITRHRNLVELKGYCLNPPSERFLVYELVEGGDLDKWLFPEDHSMRENPSVTVAGREHVLLTWGQRLKIGKGIARALEYLHSNHSHAGQIFHLDIKPRNILLESNFNPKVADFGISQIHAPGRTLEMVTCRWWTPGYVAPEVSHGIKPNSKLDVFSFGMVLLQLMSGRPVNDAQTKEPLLKWARRQVARGRISHVVDKRMLEGDIKEDKKTVMETSKRMILLALACLKDEPDERPEMRVVVKKFVEDSDTDVSDTSPDRLNDLLLHSLLEGPESFLALRSQPSYRQHENGSSFFQQDLEPLRPTGDCLEQKESEPDQRCYDDSDSSSSPDFDSFRTPPESPSNRSLQRRHYSR